MFLAKYWGCRFELVETPEWWMLNDRRGYYRHFRTTQEMRRWYRDNEEDVKIRRRRAPHYLDSWNYDEVPSCISVKSWKKLNKCKKQWMKKKYFHELYY